MFRLHSLLTWIILTFALSGCGLNQPVSIASHVWPGYEPMFLARAEGWLDTSLVRLVETDSATQSVQALVDGRVDGAALTLDEVLRVRARGIPLTVVMVFDVSAGADVLLARSEIKSVGDLKGRRIGWEHSAAGKLMALEALRKAELGESDIRFVDVPVNDHVRAWNAHQVDAIVTYEPHASQLRSQGAITLFDSRSIPNTIVDVLAIRSDRLYAGKSDAVRHLIEAHLRALSYFHRNPQDASYRMATRLGLPPKEVLPAYRGLIQPDADYNQRLLRGNPESLLATARKIHGLLADQQLLPRDLDLDELITPDFLPSPRP